MLNKPEIETFEQAQALYEYIRTLKRLNVLKLGWHYWLESMRECSECDDPSCPETRDRWRLEIDIIKNEKEHLETKENVRVVWVWTGDV